MNIESLVISKKKLKKNLFFAFELIHKLILSSFQIRKMIFNLFFNSDELVLKQIQQDQFQDIIPN